MSLLRLAWRLYCRYHATSLQHTLYNGSFLGTYSRLTLLPEMLLHELVKVLQVLLYFLLLFNLNCLLKTSLDMLLPLLALNESLHFVRSLVSPNLLLHWLVILQE